MGNLVAIPVNEKKPAGVYSVNFDSTGLPCRIYSYKVLVGSFVKTRKIVLEN